jgi:beta-lactamase regulating signal transducer with metallopeptidase domain
MNTEFSAVCDRNLGAMLNGMAEGLLVVLLLIALFRAFRRINASTRHALELTTLLLLVILPIAHFLFDSQPPSDSIAPSTTFTQTVKAEPPLPTPPLEDQPLASREEAPVPVPWKLSLPAYTSEILLGAWILISSVRLLSLSAQLLNLRALKRDGLNAPEPIRELFSNLCVELKVSRAPQLRVAAKVPAPMAVGFKEPAVLLPENLCATATVPQLEQILRHELAHVVRRDDWSNLFQQTVRALFFFHPGVIWTSRQMTVDREIACDDHVLSAVADRKTYALALTEFAASRKQGVIAAPAAWSTQSQLKQRINMILDNKRDSSPRIARGKASLFALAAILLAALAFQAAPRLAFAQTTPVEPPPAEPAVAATPAAEAAPAPEAQPVPVAPGIALIAPGRPMQPGAAVVLNAIPPAPHRVGATLTLNAQPGAPGGVLWAAAPPPPDDPTEDGFPRRKSRAKAAAAGDDDVERRLDRLEKLVESLKRDNEKRNFGFQFQDKFNPDFRFNADQFAKIGKDAAEQAQRAVEQAKRAAEKARQDADKQGDFAFKGADDIKVQRKTLEEQRQVLEKQMRAVEKQIQKLERAQQKIEDERNRDEGRRERDQKHHNHDDDDDTAKEKDAPKP